MVGKDKAIKFFFLINIENLQNKTSIHFFKSQKMCTFFCITVISLKKEHFPYPNRITMCK